MLIRIVPDMFIAEKFQCRTIHQVRKEIFETTKFLHKYPWRNQFKDKIRCLPNDFSNDARIKKYFDAINSLTQSVTINEKTSHPFDLSRVDKIFLSYALANGYEITTGDENLVDFALQEFGTEFKGNISPLGMINRCIRKKLKEWDNQAHIFLADWKVNNEHQQPDRQIRKFRKLTKRNYPGS
jgi:hypothetical protein